MSQPSPASVDTEVVTLKDGTPATIRPIRPDDAAHLQDTFDHLSMETIYQRFHAFKKELPDEEALQLATVDYTTRMAFVALTQKNGREIIIGVARYALADADNLEDAESAVVVQDEYQGRGLGKLLLGRLVRYARAKGIHHLRGYMQVGNNSMLNLVKSSGVAYQTRFTEGTWEIEIDLRELERQP